MEQQKENAELIAKKYAQLIRDGLTYSINGNVVTCYARNAEEMILAAITEGEKDNG